MTATAAQAQLTASLLNGDGTGNVYITQDATVNRISIHVANGLGADVVLPPGKPVAPGDLPPGASVVYLSFAGLIANAEVAAMTLGGPGWASATLEDPSSGLKYLAAAPTSELRVPAGGTLELPLANVLVAEAPVSGTAYVGLAGAMGVPPAQASVPLFVNVARPPHPGNDADLLAAVDVGFDEAAVYGGQTSELVLHLSNRTAGPLVPGGSSSWGATPPTFQLTAVYGDGPGALTTVADAAQLASSIANAYGNVWKPVQRHAQGTLPYWTMQPDPDGGGDVLGSGESATIEFRLAGIHASVPAGLDHALTVVYVSWSGVPGYRDGATGILVTKRAGPSIACFRASPATIPYGGSSVQTTLCWHADNADGVTFADVPGVDDAQMFAPVGSGPIPGGVVATRGAPMTITAYRSVAAAEAGERAAARAVGGHGAASRISTSAKLTVPAVDRADVPVGLGAPLALAVQPGTTTAWVSDMESARLAAVDLATGKVTTTIDLSKLVQRDGRTVTAVTALAAAPDGRTLYAVAPDPTYAPWIVVVDVEAAQATVIDLATTLPPGTQWQSANVVVSPDGSKVYASTLLLVNGATVAGEVIELDPASRAIVARHPFPSELQVENGAWLVGMTADGTGLIAATFFGIAVLTFGPSVAVRSMLQLAHAVGDGGTGWLALRAPAIGAGSLRVPALDLARMDKVAKTAPVAFLEIATDRSGSSLELARTIPLGTVVDTDGVMLSVVLLPGYGNWTAADAGGSTAYAAIPLDTLYVIDLAAGRADAWSCGGSAQDFFPIAMVAGPAAPSIWALTAAKALTEVRLTTT